PAIGAASAMVRSGMESRVSAVQRSPVAEPSNGSSAVAASALANTGREGRDAVPGIGVEVDFVAERRTVGEGRFLNEQVGGAAEIGVGAGGDRFAQQVREQGSAFGAEFVELVAGHQHS